MKALGPFLRFTDPFWCAILRTAPGRGLGRLLVLSAVTALSMLVPGTSGPGLRSAEQRESIIVELSGIPPEVVAAEQARRQGLPFDRAAHAQSILGSQNAFLAELRHQAIDFQVTETPLYLTGVRSSKPNRFGRLINAVGLEIPAGEVDRIRSMPGVRHVTIDEPVHLDLDHSVQYVRANNGPGNKTIFSQGGGPLTRFDGSGQVIAILDTGIEHTHPAFDARFDDSQFSQRTGDVRPVRLAGHPYVEGVNHPKVVYFLPFTATTNEDDVGHGTHGATDSAGLKVKGPGLDRIPGNADDQIIEGVAPGALLMNYKVCETLFTCVGTVNIVTALEDALSPTDPLDFPKPIATVINMSFGGTAGDPNSASAVAASNAALGGAVVVASAGNSGPNENTVGAPAVGRRVIAVGATNDPGASTNELDVLVDDTVRYTVAGMSTGAQNDAGRTKASQDTFMKAVLMGGAPDVTFPLGQHYVYAGFADTPNQVPDAVRGRIALASRGSTVDAGAAGTGLFGNKAAEAAAKGAVALLVFNNVDGELEAATTQAAVIPVYGVSKANGEYLRDTLGFQSPTFDENNPATWGTISNFPLRINPPDPSTFSASTTGFSSRGPADNYQYVKPDVTAPGLNVYSATIPVGGVSTGGGTMSDPSRFISVSGTSFSGPHVTGSAALVRQALLSARGQAPVDPVALRSGAGAATQQTQNGVIPQSLVRAALTNTATNLREADGETPVSNTDARTFIHEIGSGLVHDIQAVDARAALGTNDANTNGPLGPDDARDADFLPTYSFGQNVTINTEDPSQSRSITVTLQNISGAPGSGTYALSLLDGGALRGSVTRPIVGTTGFSATLSAPSVTLDASIGSQATFDVTATVDGRAAPTGLAIAGSDPNGAMATEFLWWVVASGSNGETLRMPFYYRAAATAQVFREAPFQNAIQDDGTPDQVNGVDTDGNYRLSWTFPGPPAEQPCGFQVEEASSFATPFPFSDDGSEPLVAGVNSKWTGDPHWVSSVHPNTGTPGYSVLYTDNLNVSLTMKDPVAILAGARAQLVFETFQDVEEDFDYGLVEASGDGAAFLTLAQYTGTFSGQRVVDLSGFAGQSVKVRFRLTSDSLISTPLWLGWFIDNIAIQTANWTTIGTVGASTLAFDVAGRLSGTYFYRIAGQFGGSCNVLGPYSNIRQITVSIEGGQQPVAPTADFTATPNPAQVNQQVTFDGSASHDNDDVGCSRAGDPNKCIASYLWSFGDSMTQTTSVPTTTHSYATAGTYRVSLTVTDNDGETASVDHLLEITEAPKPGQQKVSGAGYFTAQSGGRADFAFNVDSKKGSVTGHLTFEDRAAGMKVLSQSITFLSISGSTATFNGNCTVNKVAGFTFRVQVTDNGTSGTTDTFRIDLNNGYTASGVLTGGNIQIRK